MFSLFLFLAVAISASSVDHLLSPKKLFNDPKAFASVFSRADRGTLEKLVQMVDQLLSEGEADLQHATTVKNNAQSDHDTATLELGNAETAKSDAATDLVIKQGNAQTLGQAAVATGKTLDSATTKEKDASDAFDAAATFKSKTTARTTSEKESLNQILSFLVDYANASTAFTETNSDRQLLEESTYENFIMVEEDQLEKLYDLINAMIAEANKEEKNANDAYDAADAAHDDAVTELGVAQTAHSEATSAKNAADLAETQATNKLASKEAELVSAQKKEQTAAAALLDAESWLTDETTRIANEKSSLLEVKTLLENLLETAT